MYGIKYNDLQHINKIIYLKKSQKSISHLKNKQNELLLEHV